jgi:predicted nucleic-acid-binding protein
VIAIDTNVLVRYYIDDDHAQHKKAKRFFDANDVFINNIVILEAFWVLTSVYQLSRTKTGEIFDHLKRLSNVYFENETVFARALAEYRDNGCDFADALLGLLNQHYGYVTASFDREAGKKLGFKLL